MEVLKQPLSNVQLELLKTFSHTTTKNTELRKFTQSSLRQMNYKRWDKNEWTDEDVNS